jgi:HEPN domain-containing protein
VEQKYLKQYQILLRKAIVDLNSAKVILASFEKGEIELDLEVVLFHLQQSSEKFIKAVIDFNHIKFPHTHDLKDLVNLLNDNNIIIPEVEKLTALSIFAVEGRYAIIHDDMADADKFIDILDKLSAFVKATLT